VNEELKGKRVFLLAPKFFGYELEIKKELENLGATVFYFDERPQNDFFTKVFIRLDIKRLIQKQVDEYFLNIIKSTELQNLDYLFLVNPETIDVKKIDKIKQMHKNIKIFTYMWDSVKNKKKSLSLLNVSDRFFTFDLNDKSIDKKIEFLPLFYIRDYENISDAKNNLTYDVAFIGTVHSDRYKIIKQVEEQLKHHNLKTFSYFYSPSKILFLFQKLFKKDFRTIRWSDVSFQSLSKKDVVEIIKQSKAVVDIQHPLQSGLTMRTMEILGAKRKLLTTNQSIENYDFFDKNNIYILDRNRLNINVDFFNLPYQKVSKDIYEKYSLHSWIKIIF